MAQRNFTLNYTPDGVFLTVFRREAGDDKLISAYLLRKHLQAFNLRDVMTAYLSGKDSVLIAPKQAESVLDDEVGVQVKPDGSAAHAVLDMGDEAGARMTAEKILSALFAAGVSSGINAEAVQALARDPVYGRRVEVASQKPPVNGRDGFVRYHFALTHSNMPKDTSDIRVDYRELDVFEDASPGQLLATRTPATSGEDGLTVTGRALPAKPGKPANILCGGHTALSEDGGELHATKGGRVDLINGRVVVSDTLLIKESVDMSTGNITFDGNVTIKGAVINGMTVKATGSVEVGGIVEASSIEAGGSIILKQGVLGMDKAELRAGGDVVARFIEHAKVVAVGSIDADVIIHSDVMCGKRIKAVRNKGTILGSNARAGDEIVCKVAGSETFSQTLLEIALDPRRFEQLKEAKEQYVKLERDNDKTIQTLALLEKRPPTPEGEAMIGRLRSTLSAQRQKIVELYYEIEEFEKAKMEIMFGKIHVLERANEGVKIVIGAATPYIVNQPVPYATFRLIDDAVAMVSLEYSK